MNVLTPAQRGFLSRLFEQAAAKGFYLTGGSALAEYYLQHRQSDDLDLFTQDRQAWEAIDVALQAAAESMGASLEFRAARPPSELHRAFLTVSDEPRTKLDLVRDAPPHFGEPTQQADGVIVDTLENIAVGKLLAVYGRAYPRDFVDLFFLLTERALNIQDLVRLAKQKDPGLYEIYLAEMFLNVSGIEAEDLPPMLKPLDLEQMKLFFLQLATDLKHSVPEK